ncbi:MAG: hypothetical protein J7J89_02960 [Thermoplasmata archaeon]|nr:hypothetical protein [Thermoplasmata archaeon]
MNKDKIFRFLKIYLVFIICTLAINLLLEIVLRFVFEIPEELDIRGIILFFSIFNLFGTVILFFKNYNPIKMGLLSLIFGQILEFTFMRPEWVLRMYAFEFSGETIAPFIISSALYWFPTWLIPSFIIHKYIMRG